MKTLTLGFALLSILSTSAFAGSSRLECANGTIEEVGDGLFQLDITRTGLEFRPYESGFTIRSADTVRKGNTISVLNRTVRMSSEGEESTTLVNAILILKDKNTKVSLALSQDKGPFQSYELNCIAK